MIALLAPFRRLLSWLAIGFAAVAGVWLAAKRDARKEARIESLEANISTRKEIDNAGREIAASTPDAIRERLRNRRRAD